MEKSTRIYIENTGKTLCTKKVQEAIDFLSFKNGGGEICFREGTYILSTVFLRSNVSVIIEKDAVILGSKNFNDYCEDEKVDYELYQDASHSFFNCSMFVGKDCENIFIKGGGTIDMRSVWDEENKRDMVHRGAKCIALKNCVNVNICDLRIYNATDLAVYFAGCKNVLIESLKLRVHIDGISPDCCENVVIRNCNIESGDDGIVLKSSYTLNRFSECKNILVENCKVKSRCNAIKFGTESLGGFFDITIRNIYIYESNITGISIESVDGAIIRNIDIKNIEMENVTTPLFIYLGKRLRAPKGVKVGEIEDIRIENVNARGPYKPYDAIEWNYLSFKQKCTIQYPGGSMIKNLSEEEGKTHMEGSWQTTSNVCGQREKYIRNVVLRNIRFAIEGGAKTFIDKVPESSKGYPEVYMHGRALPAKGIYFRYIDGLCLDNVLIETYKEDVRESFVFENVNNCVKDAVLQTVKKEQKINLDNKSLEIGYTQ